MIEFTRKNAFFASVLSALLTLALLFYVYELQLVTVLSIPLAKSDGYFEGMLYEFLPLIAAILVLAWLRLENFGDDSKKMSFENIVFAIIFSSLSVFAVFRIIDTVFMVKYAHLESSLELSLSYVWIHASYYCLFSLILLLFSFVFFGKKGLRSLFTIYVIPVFYVLNADLVMVADKVSSLSVLYPFYLFILELGRAQTLALGGLLNIIGFRTFVNTNVFPFLVNTGGVMYSVDLPCIGWEGIAAYTIIFVNLIIDIEKRNKRRVLWWVLGFVGTLTVNLLRLTLIFVGGAIGGISVATAIHHNAGDFIFLFWILGFTYAVYRLRTFRFNFHVQKSEALNHKENQG